MDDFTRAHMRNWIRTTICEFDVDPIATLMEKTFETDPEFYLNNSWWKCYDQAFSEQD